MSSAVRSIQRLIDWTVPGAIGSGRRRTFSPNDLKPQHIPASILVKNGSTPTVRQVQQNVDALLLLFNPEVTKYLYFEVS